MITGDVLTPRGLLFLCAAVAILIVSWKPLKKPGCHGFYRFFGFEGIVLLAFFNTPFWFRDRFSPLQLVSWILLFTSVLFVTQGYYLLRRKGGFHARQENPENFTFENTAHLVTAGIYRYIRHPLYSSLLLLAWGIFLKNISLPGTVIVLLTTAALIATARVEEEENLSFFGPDYRDYIRRTKQFIPFLY